MAKRKRGDVSNDVPTPGPTTAKKTKASEPQENNRKTATPVIVQIVTGSYDRILHGITATISSAGKVEFADTFLFNAHTSAIRCLALSPPSVPEPGRAQKVMLASGSNDERINVYNISAHPPKRQEEEGGEGGEEEEGDSKSKSKSKKKEKSMNEMLSTLAPRRILEDPRNRELGTLLHHSASVTRLSFPTRAKLLSASEDASVAVTRTRDWALLSAIKTPIPKPLGRPSGDTAALGAAPHGVVDFAVHPSMKLMLTVGRGERCMRLWNLMTARKAGVLNFGRDVLPQVGEGKHALGEGRRVVWGVAGDDEGDEFCVAFDRDLLVYGMDSTPKCRVMPDHRTKVHEVCYVVTDTEKDAALLAVSTEDGRIMFFSTRSEDLTTTPKASSKEGGKKAESSSSSPSSLLPVAKLVAQIGGKEAGVTGRIKDFSILRASQEEGGGGGKAERLIIPTGSSDGKVRIFTLSIDELNKARKGKEAAAPAKKQIGKLLGTYETSNRITCLEAFVMIPRPEGVEDSEDEDEFEGVSGGGDEEEEEEEDDDEEE
ncbi:putative wd domain-containing protein [Eutypa lata UCREL1]|uniref:Putative wd domain-containing protein n=1 Tax=Eutypa lata (strain UCR-EL1) TaxID=1287681 RepID=M7TEX8_EUTLA|nr:putative wd domain-containing protein [Eutypa lata UCREL1]